MANYYATARSNYFRVKDEGKFREWVKATPDIEIGAGAEDDSTFALLGCNADGAGWPTERLDEDTDEHEEMDFFGELSKHLAKDSVAILMEVGAEKLRYLVGYAVAVNSEGEVATVSLEDIYKRVTEILGTRVEATPCEY